MNTFGIIFGIYILSVAISFLYQKDEDKLNYAVVLLPVFNTVASIIVIIKWIIKAIEGIGKFYNDW